MPAFFPSQYTSDLTECIRELKTNDPGVDARQIQGHALLWNKQVDTEAWAGYDKARVAQKPYVYHTEGE